jgi:prepilin-type N-terminal cleavage/methylation domain-containing protein
MKHSRSGFTLIEVLIAIIVLGVGIITLMGGSSSITRMIGRGKMETRAAQAASRRMEILRLAADASSPRCTHPEFAAGGPVVSGGVSERWQVSGAGKVRQVSVTVSYLTVRGVRTARLETRVTC